MEIPLIKYTLEIKMYFKIFPWLFFLRVLLNRYFFLGVFFSMVLFFRVHFLPPFFDKLQDKAEN